MPERLQLREGWSSLALLLVMLLAMALSFETGGLAEGLRILPGIVLLGVLIGFVVAKTGLPSFLAHPLGLLAGIGTCFALAGTLLILPLDVPMIGAPSFGLAAVAEAKWLLLQQHLGTWLGALVHGETSRDPLPFVVQIAALAWLLSFYGAWFVFRSHRVWAAVLPVALITFLSVYYAPPRLLVYFVLCLFGGLLLVARANVYQREMEWQKEHVLYEPNIGSDFLRAGTQLSLFLLVLVWLVPRPDFQQMPLRGVAALRAPWQRVQEEWRRLYSSLSYSGPKATAPFGRAVTLSGGVRFTDTPVLKIEVSEGHYWRALVLDEYTGRGWIDTSPVALSLGPDAPLVDRAALRARQVLTQTVTSLRPGEQLLYAAGEPWRVSVATRVQAAAIPQGEQQPAEGQLEVSAIYLPAEGTEGPYTARSLISTASAKKMAEAPMDYPDWVTARYLQLPAAFPARIGELARQVAGDAPTPYDQAQAIEAYLRKLTYNQSIAAPPADRDPVEWFLFEYRQGYCTYFASAMVLMCRSLGLPARFVQGYASGEYDREQGAIVVRELDAHAWPEVYFPGYGWIEFEPTPARALIVRSTEGEGGPAPTPGPTPEYQGGRGPQGRGHLPELDDEPGGAPRRRPAAWQRLPWAAMVGALLLASLAWAAWRPLARRWRLLRPAERLYLQLTWTAAAAGVSSEPYQTPLEFGRSLAEALGPGRYHVTRIVQAYVQECFGGGVSDVELRAARGAWRRLRRMVPGQVLRNRLRNRR